MLTKAYVPLLHSCQAGGVWYYNWMGGDTDDDIFVLYRAWGNGRVSAFLVRCLFSTSQHLLMENTHEMPAHQLTMETCAGRSHGRFWESTQSGLGHSLLVWYVWPTRQVSVNESDCELWSTTGKCGRVGTWKGRAQAFATADWKPKGALVGWDSTCVEFFCCYRWNPAFFPCTGWRITTRVNGCHVAPYN